MRMVTRPVDSASPAFLDNRTAQLALLERLHAHLDRAERGGGERYRDRHRARGKLLARERVDLLLDPGSPFLDLCPLAGLHESGTVPGGAMIAGLGWVAGRLCIVNASDPTASGGAVTPWGLRRSARVDDIAAANGLPVIHLVESAGADLPNQAEIFVPGGERFRDITRRSARGLPTMSVVFGSCTAGGAYIPGMSDVSIGVVDASYMYLAGPPLVQMATGEAVDDETLGGARMHAEVSGVLDHLATDERDALRIARDMTARFRAPVSVPPRAAVDEPTCDAEELLGLVPVDLKVPFDCRDVIARIVDGSRFVPFKERYGPGLVCGWAELGGYRIGILGNNSILFPESADKAAQFIQLCNRNGTPLLFLQNITGFMVGAAVEKAGIIKAGAKMINAVANATVPLLTVMMGSSYGAGNYAMAGRAYQPRFLFSWPSHRIAVMGPEQLVGVLDIVKRAAAARRGTEVDEEKLEMMKQMLAGKVDHESTVWNATGRLWDDGVIDPRQTRAVLAMALAAVHEAPGDWARRDDSRWGAVRH